MEEIRDRALLEKWRKSCGVDEKFDTPNLKFQAFRYEKGELLTEPERPLQYILFLAEGRVDIYGIRSDGGMIPVNQAAPPMMLGDMEYCGRWAANYTEAVETVACLALPIEENREKLDRDVCFLRELSRSLSAKVELFSILEISAEDVEERVLIYMRRYCPGGTLRGIQEATLHLRCSRRQLQRVLKKLCEEGRIEKRGKGCYQLVRP